MLQRPGAGPGPVGGRAARAVDVLWGWEWSLWEQLFQRNWTVRASAATLERRRGGGHRVQSRGPARTVLCDALGSARIRDLRYRDVTMVL